MSTETVLNDLTSENITSINPEMGNNITSVNSVLTHSLSIDEGTELPEGYVVVGQMDVTSSEADLYRCKKDGCEYVVKIYRREVAIKDEIVSKLIQIDSPYVSKVYATGYFDGRPYEILPYYKTGSLYGKKYTYIELKKHIIPSLNEGIHVLHENGIIHKDLKPSNIMLNDNQVDVAIIDFGISSVRDSSNTVILTKTGMTPEYSAPETFKNLFLSESDYYSFGITIYELFCGHTPYVDMNSEEIEKYVSVQKIPFPEDMPEDLQNLIAALTYYDITNRKNKKNPNRRWGYEEVKKWCNGEEMVIPGEGSGIKVDGIQPYKFLGKTYNDKSTLVEALAKNWDEGKKQLFRGILSGFFKNYDPEIASFCLDAEDAVRTQNEDFIFLATLYKIDDSTQTFFWKGQKYDNLSLLGNQLLKELWSGRVTPNFYDEILSNEVLTIYADSIGIDDENVRKSLRGLESSYKALKNTETNRLRVLYLMAYMLSGNKIMRKDNKDFSSVEDISSYMNELLSDSYVSFEKFCKGLMDETGELDPQFESWLIAVGKQREIAEWRKELK